MSQFFRTRNAAALKIQAQQAENYKSQLLQLNWFRLHFEGKKLNLVTDGSD
jgi:hypothetical protein